MEKAKNLKLNTSKKILSLFMGANIILLGGCNHKVDCEINTPHAHAYIDEDGLISYIQSEKEKCWYYYDRTDGYVNLNEEEQNIIKFENKKRLIRINENLDRLIELTNDNIDYYVYEYTYKLHESHRLGVHCFYTWEEKTEWTNNPYDIDIFGYHKELELTGNIKTAHYVYPTYKIIKNEKGKYKVVPGPTLDNIEDATHEYPYVKLDYATVVYLDIDENIKTELNENVVKKITY